MQRLQLIGVPFDLNRPGYRMGATPAALLPRLAALPLPWADAPVVIAPTRLTGTLEPDLMQIVAALSDAVRAARERNALPVVIGGDCLTAIGSVGGLDGAAAGVVWLDAHGDFNTPATTPSGYLGGMPLAALTGRCLTELTAAAGVHHPFAEAHMALLGVRDLDPPEQTALAASPISVFSTAQLREQPDTLEQTLARIGGAGPVYLHVDVDVLDPSVMPGVVYPTPGGLALHELEALLGIVRRHCTLAAVTLTAMNLIDGDQEAALAAAERVVQAALGPTSA